jgi:hypothetical protein
MRAAVKWQDWATKILSPPDLLPIHCPKNHGVAMAKMWRWVASLQEAVELLHQRSMLAWHAPKAGVLFLAGVVWGSMGVV